MLKVSVNILTKNRAELLSKALAGIVAQSFKDFEIVLVNDGSSDGTQMVLTDFKNQLGEKLKIISHAQPLGITASRQEALEESRGEYVAVLDDDDQWKNPDKLKMQVGFLDKNPGTVLVGGGILIFKNQYLTPKLRPQSDVRIRQTMLFRNNFFTSTVMFSRQKAVESGGFVKDQDDFAEDYDLWLRMGKLGKMANLPEVLAVYSQPDYNIEKFKKFLAKQRRLINREKDNYPYYFLANLIFILRSKLF